MRERPHKSVRELLRARITPARAGKTEFKHEVAETAQDHPRSCGKDMIVGSSASYRAGSPPLVRERRQPGMLSLQSRWDHPRSCGKDRHIGHGLHGGAGSPPLVRERHGPHVVTNPYLRITPARAGKTMQSFPDQSRCEDHPRSCGKDFCKSCFAVFTLGSPPLVRERHSFVRRCIF